MRVPAVATLLVAAAVRACAMARRALGLSPAPANDNEAGAPGPRLRAV